MSGPVEKELRKVLDVDQDWFRVSDDAYEVVQCAAHFHFGHSMEMFWPSSFPDVMSYAIEAAEALGL